MINDDILQWPTARWVRIRSSQKINYLLKRPAAVCYDKIHQQEPIAQTVANHRPWSGRRQNNEEPDCWWRFPRRICILSEFRWWSLSWTKVWKRVLFCSSIARRQQRQPRRQFQIVATAAAAAMMTTTNAKIRSRQEVAILFFGRDPAFDKWNNLEWNLSAKRRRRCREYRGGDTKEVSHREFV